MALLADVLLVIHFMIAAFITLGFIVIPLGGWRNWRIARTRRLRQAHLVAIVFVAAETLLGIACPLTVWEDMARGTDASARGGFIAGAVRPMLYYDVPLWWFGVIYVVAAVLAIAAWFALPPAGARTHGAGATPRRPLA
jgi:hypothetical protein